MVNSQENPSSNQEGIHYRNTGLESNLGNALMTRQDQSVMKSPPMKPTSKIFRAILSIGVWICNGCSQPAKVETPSLFGGHAVGESSGAFAMREGLDIDPLAKCQQIIRSTFLEQSLASAQRCREFVDRGSYQINLRGPDPIQERIFQFTNWRVSLIILRFKESGRNMLVADFDARFTNSVPGRLWRTRDNVSLEIRPAEQFELFTGKPNDSGGFLVVVTPLKP
jgi:hypothetical protein